MESFIILDGNMYYATVKKEGHVVTLDFKDEVPSDLHGFEYFAYPGAVSNNYKSFNTVYRYEEGIYQLSDDGSVYVEPTHTLIVAAVFDDGGEGDRPDHIDVMVDTDDMIHGGHVTLCTLDETNSFTAEFYNVKESANVKISAPELEGWTMTIEGGIITYYYPHEVVVPPTTEERLASLEESMDEVYVSVTDLMYDVTMLQFGISDEDFMMEGDM